MKLLTLRQKYANMESMSRLRHIGDKLKNINIPGSFRKIGIGVLSVLSFASLAGCDSAPAPEAPSAAASANPSTAEVPTPTPEANLLSHEQAQIELQELFTTTRGEMLAATEILKQAPNVDEQALDIESGFNTNKVESHDATVDLFIAPGYEPEEEYDATPDIAKIKEYNFAITIQGSLGRNMQYLFSLKASDCNPAMSWREAIDIIMTSEVPTGILIVQTSDADSNWEKYEMVIDDSGKVQVTRINSEGNTVIADPTEGDIELMDAAKSAAFDDMNGVTSGI